MIDPYSLIPGDSSLSISGSVTLRTLTYENIFSRAYRNVDLLLVVSMEDGVSIVDLREVRKAMEVRLMRREVRRMLRFLMRILGRRIVSSVELLEYLQMILLLEHSL